MFFGKTTKTHPVTAATVFITKQLEFQRRPTRYAMVKVATRARLIYQIIYINLVE